MHPCAPKSAPQTPSTHTYTHTRKKRQQHKHTQAHTRTRGRAAEVPGLVAALRLRDRRERGALDAPRQNRTSNARLL
eukprot:517681-Pelagomonas_calceolata.AAC.4